MPVRDIEVSSHGRIKLPTGQIVSGRRRGNYMRYQTHGVHRLVAEAFCPRPPGADTVNHKDGTPTNNRAENLEWTTQRANCVHAHAAGLCRRRAVRRVRPDGTTTDYASIKEASRQCHISAGDIVGACKGTKARAGGSKWSYASPEGADSAGDTGIGDTGIGDAGGNSQDTSGNDPQDLDASAENAPQNVVTDAELEALLSAFGL